MTVKLTAKLGPQSRAKARSGIGTRLTLAFASIAILTALAGGASSLLSLQGGDIVKGLGAKTLPTVTASMSYAQHSSVLAAEAPTLATSKDAASLEAEASRLDAMIKAQAGRLAALRTMVTQPALLDPVAASSDGLAAKIAALKSQTAERIALHDRLDKKLADAFSAYQDMMDFVRPLQEATQTGVDALVAGSQSTDESGNSLTGLSGIRTELPNLKTLMDIQANGNLALGMLSAAATSQNDDASSDMRSQYNWAELNLNKAIKAYGPGPDGEKMGKLSAALLSAGAGDDNVFLLKQRLSDYATQGAALVQTMLEQSSALSKTVEDLVKAEELAAGNEVVHSSDVTQQSLVVNGALSGIVLIASLLIGWLYVHRVVVRRMNGLAGVMGRLASGDRSVTINTAGKDEITAMASAVEVFKDNMLRGDELATQAERLSQEREHNRQLSDRERAEASAQQASVVEGLASGLARLAKGDLTCLLDHPFPPQYEGLRRDFNDAVQQLQSVMQQIVHNADNLRTGTNEISSATDDLSRRTEQQAATLEQTAAALDQITATVRKTSEGASHARDVVGATKADAERSGRVVRDAVGAMSGIEKSAGQISQIIGVIDEIAFQTNLLALNAGVEAARAGDAGRGFAVVASEVRSLAQRSAEAAKEIKALIRASSAQVEQGVDLVGQTGLALEHILKQVAEINTIVTEIAASAKEQTTGLEQVNTAVNEMDQVTQQNAAMVEETTAASHSLARDTQTLAGLIGRFQVGPEVAAAPASTTARPGRARSMAASVTKRIVALKTTGRGGAAPKTETANWEEF